MWIGGSLIVGGALFAFGFLAKMMPAGSDSFTALDQEVSLPRNRVACEFNLGLKDTSPVLPTPDIQGEMTFSYDPPRPGSLAERDRLLVRLKKSAEFKRVYLPCRLWFETRSEMLSFSSTDSFFWMELAPSDNQVECKLFINVNGETVQSDRFLTAIQECPVRNSLEFPENSAFRILAESQWLGKDLLHERLEERIKIGSSEQLTLKEGEWLVFKNGKWEKGDVQENAPIAHIESIQLRGLILEGWGDEGHVRLLLNSSKEPSFKIKAEELLSSVRIRSEKQVSCMLEKQCIILRLSDWAIKINGRWKILRKSEERQAFLKGKMAGELFILDEIAQQRMIRGRLFNTERTQMIPIEIAVQRSRRTKQAPKGKT